MLFLLPSRSFHFESSRPSYISIDVREIEGGFYFFVAIYHVHGVFFFRNVASVFRFYLFVSSIIKIIRKKEHDLSRVPRTFSKNVKRLIFLFLPLLFYTLKYNRRKKIQIERGIVHDYLIFVFLPPLGRKLWKIFVTRNSQNAKSLILFSSHSTTGLPDQS